MIATRQLTLMSEAAPSVERMVLRPYQHRAVVSIAEAWAAGKRRVLLVAPTGSGKTAMACALIAELERRGRPVLFCVHRDVLIDQTTQSMERWGIAAGHIKAGYRENRDRLVQVCSVQSLVRREWWGAQDFDWEHAPPTMVLDEAHTTGWSAVVRGLLDEHPLMRVCGLTATPWRLSKKEDMGDVFDGVALSPVPAQLIADGFLVPPVYYGVAVRPDLSGVRTRGGEYVEEDLGIACDTGEMVAALVDDYQRLAPGERALAFTVTVAHALHVAEECKRRGIPAAAVSGETPLDERARHYDGLRTGRLKLLASCAVLSEGFDVPEVACCLLARPTKSRALFHQQLGRGLRIAPWDGKERALIVDQAGNVRHFGFVEDFDAFTLRDGRSAFAARSKEDDEDSSTTKECPQCHLVVRANVPRCPGCGYLWPLPKMGPAFHTQALLRRDLPLADRVLSYRDQLLRAYREGWKPEAAAVRYRDAFGQWPDRAWCRGAVWGMHATDAQRDDYRRYLEDVAAEKEMADADVWVARWMAAELGQ
jgi:superfamily II DNA or RNA helicase